MKITAILIALSILSGCKTLSDKENLAFIAGALTLGAAAYYAGKGGGSSAGTAGYAPIQDMDWAWDLQRNGVGGLVWVCRGQQTGQYSEQKNCEYKYQTDNTWPGY